MRRGEKMKRGPTGIKRFVAVYCTVWCNPGGFSLDRVLIVQKRDYFSIQFKGLGGKY